MVFEQKVTQIFCVEVFGSEILILRYRAFGYNFGKNLTDSFVEMTIFAKEQKVFEKNYRM